MPPRMAAQAFIESDGSRRDDTTNAPDLPPPPGSRPPTFEPKLPAEEMLTS